MAGAGIALVHGFSDNARGQSPAQSTEADLAHAPALHDQGPQGGIAASAIRNGRAIALGQNGANGSNASFPCFQCHRTEGAGAVSADIPRIASQTFRYLLDSLHNFASGDRPSDVMQPVARSLTDQQMLEVAAYYAVQTVDQSSVEAAAAAQPGPDAETLSTGGMIAAIGLADRGVQACQNCHGPQGAGLPPTYPYLAGQLPGYLEAQLKAFKSGKRGGDGYAIMRQIAARLTDDQIHAVAEYYAAIRPPRPFPQGDLSGPLQIGVPLTDENASDARSGRQAGAASSGGAPKGAAQ